MGFIVIIPARLASTRLPNKPLADLGGKPMVVRVAERAAESGASRVIVATDHLDIAAACAAHGVEAFMTRSDHPSGTDRIAEVARALALPMDAVVVNLQGDEPLIDPALLSACAAQIGPGVPMATCAHPLHDAADAFNPNVVKVVLDKAGRALYFSRATSAMRSVPDGWSARVMHTSTPCAMQAAAMSSWSVATMIRAAPDSAARSATRTTIGLPPRSASGLLGRRVEARRAGMMTMKPASAPITQARSCALRRPT